MPARVAKKRGINGRRRPSQNYPRSAEERPFKGREKAVRQNIRALAPVPGRCKRCILAAQRQHEIAPDVSPG
jgi:hypothetical protein